MTKTPMSKDDAVELFELRCRGALAAAFSHANIQPTEEQWQMLRGDKEITMRDMGEISFMTCLNFQLSFVERARDEDQT
jgi:hypothetical protein